MKSNKIYFIVFFLLVLSLNLIIADFTLGDPESDIVETYSPRDPISGWINISFNNQVKTATLNGFSNSINILDFLEDSNAVYSCFPSDCDTAYTSSNPTPGKTFSLISGQKGIMGLKLVGQVTGIDTIAFDVSIVDSDGSCATPLKIDVLDNGVLDSGYMDWQAQEVSSELCPNPTSYGCYNEADYTGSTFLIIEEPYCARTEISSGKGFRIGAEVIEAAGGGGDATFKIIINTPLESKECFLNANTTSTLSCSISFTSSIEEPTEAEICISADSASDSQKYEIKYERVNSCGYAGPESYDFPIFINPLRYSSISDFTFNEDFVNDGGSGLDLSNEIAIYISSKYGGDCDPECIVPIIFHSGETQIITVSNLNFVYLTGGATPESNLYDISETEVLINSNFQKLDLEKGGFLTPSTSGEGEFILELDNEEVLRETISIVPMAKIVALLPETTAALVPTEFTIHLSEDQEGLTYLWDFGDNSILESTDTNKVTHTYQDVGIYSAKVTIKNDAGNSTKTFSIKTIPPEQAISEKLEEYNLGFIKFKADLSALPVWIKNEIEDLINIDDIGIDLRSYETDYERAFNEESYVNLMKMLLDFKIPFGLSAGQTIPTGAFFLDKDQLNLEILEDLGAGSFDEEEDYDTIINTWLVNSLDAYAESKTYSIDYPQGTENLVSYVKITLEPNQNLGEVYFIVNGDPIQTRFSDESNTKNIGENAKALIFDELAQSRIVEFLYPGIIESGNYPVYISPRFNELEFGIRPGICNFNDICEKELDENYKNCRNDCKPTLLIALYLSILVVIFLVVYIALQEWYKRRYESKLFSDKNQLFNLINFMNNSLNQGINKATIFDKLKDLDWSEEQLNYAWKKFNGERTGMWEIPIFKWVENNQVKKEIEKRQGIAIQKKPAIQKRTSRRIRRPRSNLRRSRPK